MPNSDQHRSVLVVDREPNVLQLVVDVLESRGWEVHWASHGGHALALFYESQPTLVLLDLRLLGIDGWSLAGEIRRHRAVSIVLMTREADAEFWAREIGARALLKKPFGAESLCRVVDMVTQHSSSKAA